MSPSNRSIVKKPIAALIAGMLLLVVGAHAAAFQNVGTTVNPNFNWQAEVTELTASNPNEASVKRLIEIDDLLKQHLKSTDKPAAGVDAVQKSVLVALARQRTPVALEYLRSVFETETVRRDDAAYAISLAALKRPTNDQDWRYLVRSLPIVEGQQAVSVLKALRRFRRKASKPVWVREVILLGVSLPARDRTAAVELLRYWTERSDTKSIATDGPITLWQQWFRKTYPGEPAAELPVDPPGARWTGLKLADVINRLPRDVDSITAGEAVYIKAGCVKCHRRGNISGQPGDNRLGPDLTSLGWRRQVKEIAKAILFPSHDLNEEYPVTTIVLGNGIVVSGLLMPDGDDYLKVVDSTGKEIRFRKSTIEDTQPATVSNMPTGMLEALSQQEILHLFAFLSVTVGELPVHDQPTP